ncbi:MAG: 5-dehydro-4-deoxy-D-glucuronate isomerase [Bacteroidales bacterium]|nr:5-dehydro-4-deoxy-D-glucuronate isomerase [Bacteroidales bacterium]
MKVELRYATNPKDFKSYDTERLRKDFLFQNVFLKDEISLVYSMYDRFIFGGAMPVNKQLKLETTNELKAEHFLERREMGIINIGGDAVIDTKGKSYNLKFKEALYLGKETLDVVFKSVDAKNPAKLYINSSPAHHTFPSKKVTRADAELVEMGNQESSNKRTINKLLVCTIIDTCQLQMGMTELKTGSVWNTMPVHTHNRRMECYFYFEVPDKQVVCHFLGDPDETRHIWLSNEQAVLSPPWSIHSAAGTTNYSFIWGMSGENMDFGDLDNRDTVELK